MHTKLAQSDNWMAKVKEKKDKKSALPAAGGTGDDAGGTKSRKKAKKQGNDSPGDQNPSLLGSSGRGRNYTVSAALPGSVIASYASGGTTAACAARVAAVAAQIARAALASCIDEIVVYDDEDPTPSSSSSAATSVSGAAAFLAQALQYLETPPYLRQSLCPLIAAEVAAALAATGPMHAPHHLNQTDWRAFREGVVLKTTAAKDQGEAGHSFVDVGLDRMAYVPMHLPMNARVTLSVGEQPSTSFVPEYSETMIMAEAVSPITPRVKLGAYWGFTVRLASSLHDVLKGSAFKGGYDLTIGTSSKGIAREHSDLVLPRFSHLLLVLGGASKGLHEVIEGEEPLAGKSPEDLFNMFLNVCPHQGSAVIRTEDALLLALGYLRPAVLKYGGNVKSAP